MATSLSAESAAGMPGTPKSGRKTDRPHLADLEQALKKTLFPPAQAAGAANVQPTAAPAQPVLAQVQSEAAALPVDGCDVADGAVGDATVKAEEGSVEEAKEATKPAKKSRFSVKKVEVEEPALAPAAAATMEAAPVQAPAEVAASPPLPAEEMSATSEAAVEPEGSVRFVLGSSNASAEGEVRREEEQSDEKLAKTRRFKVTKIPVKPDMLEEEMAHAPLDDDDARSVQPPVSVSSAAHTPATSSLRTLQVRPMPAQAAASARRASYRPSSVLSEYSTTSTMSPEHHDRPASKSPPHPHCQPISAETPTPVATPVLSPNARLPFGPDSHVGKESSGPQLPDRARHASDLETYTQQLDAALHSALHITRCPCHLPHHHAHSQQHLTCPPRHLTPSQSPFATHTLPTPTCPTSPCAHSYYATVASTSVTSPTGGVACASQASSAVATQDPSFVRNWLGFGLLAPSGQPVTAAAISREVCVRSVVGTRLS